MLYLKTSVKNGIISLYPLNPDEMYYKCEVCGNFYGIDNLSDFSFDDVFLKDYICPQCEAGVIVVAGRVLKCYPKYLLNAKEPTDELRKVIKVLEKYNAKGYQF